YRGSSMVRKPVVDQCAPPADELDSGHLLGALERPYGYEADLAGSAGVGPSAWRPVKPLYLDHPDGALDGALFPEWEPGCFGFRDEMDTHRAVLKDHSVRNFFGGFHVLIRGTVQLDVDSASGGAEVKGPRLSPTRLNECLRENMLAAVLLHVVQ